MNTARGVTTDETQLRLSNPHNDHMSSLPNLSLLGKIKPTDDADGDEFTAMNSTLRSELAICQRIGEFVSSGHRECPVKKRRITWYCCQCGDGPNEVNYVLKCLECGHERCESCTLETTKA